MPEVKIQITTEIDLDIETAAKWFAHLTDDEMCKFIVIVADEAEKWPHGPDNQWYYLGGHLRNCPCSTDAAREMIKSWAHWIDHSNHV